MGNLNKNEIHLGLQRIFAGASARWGLRIWCQRPGHFPDALDDLSMLGAADDFQIVGRRGLRV